MDIYYKLYKKPCKPTGWNAPINTYMIISMMIYCAFVFVTLLTYFHPGLHGLKKCASFSIVFHCSAVSAEWKKKKSWIQTLLRIDSELTPNPKRHDRPVRSDGFDIATWWKFGQDVRDGQREKWTEQKKL